MTIFTVTPAYSRARTTTKAVRKLVIHYFIDAISSYRSWDRVWDQVLPCLASPTITILIHMNLCLCLSPTLQVFLCTQKLTIYCLSRVCRLLSQGWQPFLARYPLKVWAGSTSELRLLNEQDFFNQPQRA